MNILVKCIILGIAASVQGLAMAVFLFPHFIPSGGAASLGVLLNILLNIPYAYSLWFLNAGLLLAAVKWLGKKSALWTMYCVTVTSSVINWISPLIKDPLSYVLLDIAFGSVFFGLGLGILFRMGASSGGMDILALILSRAFGFSPGKALFLINGILLGITGIVVSWNIIIYALLCQFIGTKVLDAIYKLPVKSRSLKAHKEQEIF
ncbi:YitT family protein [Metabacillus sp. Hm71]|uniref:YitT family protein n=1 Tax=Metabacillus sp. Hm71 TaxID=3450743 RepID=UPI003F42CA6D